MRVAFDARSLEQPAMRGWDRYTVGVGRALSSMGLDLTLFCHAGSDIPKDRLAGISAAVVKLKRGLGPWWEQVALPRALKRHGIDIYHAPAEHGIPLRSTCPKVLTLHSATLLSYRDLIGSELLEGPVSRYVSANTGMRGLFTEAYWNAQVRSADFVIAPSEFAREEIVRLVGVPPKSVTTIPLALDAQFTRPRKPKADLDDALREMGVRAPYLIYVGGYEPHKNVHGLLTMFGHVQRERADLGLVLVGTGGVPPSLRDKSRDLGVAGRTRFLHDLGPELTDLYDGAALFVSMSWRETFCLPALEAMSRGVPAVASEWGSAPDVIGAGGLVTDPRDPVRFAEIVLETLGGDRRESLAAEAPKQAKRFSWEHTAQLTMRVYEQLLADPE